VHLVGFIMRIHRDARPSECKSVVVRPLVAAYIIYILSVKTPINAASPTYLKVMWIRTLGHGVGNGCGGDTLSRVKMTHAV